MTEKIMNNSKKYQDIRQDFWKKYWNAALPFDAYLQTGKESHQRKWQDTYDRLKLTEEQKNLAATFVRNVKVIVLTGIWCGDCSRQGPVIQKISEANSCLEVRFIDNNDNPELQDELRINGAKKVPVVLFLNEDFFELGRFGDRHLAAYRTKLSKEAGVACSTGLAIGDDVLAQETVDWMDQFERMHAIVRLSPFYREKYGD